MRHGCAGEGGVTHQTRYRIHRYLTLVADEVDISYMSGKNIRQSVRWIVFISYLYGVDYRDAP